MIPRVERSVLLAAGLAVAVVGCDSGSLRDRERSDSERHSAAGVEAVCAAAVPGLEAVSATLTTVAAARSHRVGPGLSPAAAAFPGAADGDAAVWCWVRVMPDLASRPDGASAYEVYAVAAPAAARFPEPVLVATIGEGSAPRQTSGAPIVP